ncbi:Peptidoglycan/xylan/chitin deacetylase, PgdA/CDA1 family [Clostridium cavendishii DSM 21758]|uniref:Peptidoglycan/xylan/chitin deacetylase, PgdA/CDA1 family n=1 Tax=Clostridium cavendishii DSM 21758 TaxID=1121302 RepID=A0A1M6CVL7_9CLOT|nr:polysaccharide deacetylase family protein [Clostridium cavendishii]SHI65062.1 Peptidoglycan/xylan/chitin deacetylase, PgdA/CDA1 family [Clostridium cavendishii DSM 21758]
MKIKKFLVYFLVLAISIIYIPNTKTFATEDSTEDSKCVEKIVYITFDDGPGGKVTSQILDTLKEYDAKATFFVIGNMVKGQEELLKRMFKEGHSIGLHTFTHEQNKIYRNSESFIDEMLQAQNAIESATGCKPNILRFPFGCNNNTYKLTSTMVDKLHEKNLKIYDWNVDSTDGMNPRLDPGRIAQRAKSKKDMAIVLMHCGYVNKNTAKALPDILKYYKDNGYKFKVIDESTPELYRVRKKK